MRKWSKKRSGHTESGLSSRDIVRHWNTDNTIELVSVFSHDSLLHNLTPADKNCGNTVKWTGGSLNFGQSEYAYLA